MFPSDCVLVSTSLEDGSCYIETANLDGETNLKKRQVMPGYRQHADTEAKRLERFRGRLEAEAPNEYLNQFLGRLCVDVSGCTTPSPIASPHQLADTKDSCDGATVSVPLEPLSANKRRSSATSNECTYPLTLMQTCLRGVVLRNTDHVYGIVVYVGPDTKIMRNLTTAGLKHSSYEKVINFTVLGVFFVNAVVLLVSALLGYFWEMQNGGKAWYLKSDNQVMLTYIRTT